MLTTVALVLAIAAMVLAVAVLVWAVTAPKPAPTVDDAYDSLPAGRPELHVDTATGSHDRYEHMADSTRDIVIAYCEQMWRHTPAIRPAAPEES